MANPDVSKETPQKDTSHSRFRKGLTDYGDGANVTHHLGNDDYDGSNINDENDLKENAKLEGKVAEGNLEMNEEQFASDKDKAEKDDLRSQ